MNSYKTHDISNTPFTNTSETHDTSNIPFTKTNNTNTTNNNGISQLVTFTTFVIQSTYL